MERLQAELRALYQGSEPAGRHFRLLLLGLDVLLLGYFIASSFLDYDPWLRAVDLAVAAFIGADVLARLFVANFRLRDTLRLQFWADVVVIVSLVLPALLGNLLFLRVLRAMRLFHSYHVMADLRDISPFFRAHEEVIEAVINLVVFIFVVSAIVLVAQVRANPDINNYLDALYFTISTVTTTGFGDIVMRDPAGRLLAVAMMVIGFALFFRLVRAAFRADRRRIDCPHCGLVDHERDAAHCRRCGTELVLHQGR